MGFSLSKLQRECTAYLAPEGFVPQLEAELSGIVTRFDRLIVAAGPPQESYWAQNIWYEPRLIEIGSVGDAAKKLRALQRDWWPYSFQLHRRSELIQSQLARPRHAAGPLSFPQPLPEAPLGSWTLVDDSHLFAAPLCSSRFPNGEAKFVEFKEDEGPPSRAYLKLFEALTVAGAMPQKGERCLEIGAAPGGWTWVLATLGASVKAVDRAALAPRVAAMPGVEGVQGDAFAFDPDTVGPVDWLFSDLICYPDRLLAYLEPWLSSELCRNFVCTIKLQGDAHYATIPRFAAVPGSRILHLSHNKHELTWMKGAKLKPH